MCRWAITNPLFCCCGGYRTTATTITTPTTTTTAAAAAAFAAFATFATLSGHMYTPYRGDAHVIVVFCNTSKRPRGHGTDMQVMHLSYWRIC